MARKKTGYIQDRGTSFRISYYDLNGIRQFESFKTRDHAELELAQRLADLSKGLPTSSKPNTVLFGELAVDVTTDYEVNNRKSYDDIEARFRLHIIPVFGRRKASQITTAQLNQYIVYRRAENAKTGTINRELEAIKHTFKLAMKHGKILHMPHIPHLKESNTRAGFLTREQVDRLRSHLKAPYGSFVLFAFLTGWRYSEIQNLRWSNVDFVRGEIRLDAGSTKSGAARVFPMGAELRGLLEAIALAGHAKLHRLRNKVVAAHVVVADLAKHVFPVGSFRKSWKTACYKAGLPCTVEPIKIRGKLQKKVKVMRAEHLFHDLRRSAAREFQRQGFTEGQIMRMCGWVTRSVFDRYAIVTDSDIREKMDALDGATNGAKTDSARG